MSEQYVMIAVRESTKAIILDRCVKEYISFHPELRRMKITSDKIIYEMARFFLKDNQELRLNDE